MTRLSYLCRKYEASVMVILTPLFAFVLGWLMCFALVKMR